MICVVNFCWLGKFDDKNLFNEIFIEMVKYCYFMKIFLSFGIDFVLNLG